MLNISRKLDEIFSKQLKELKNINLSFDFIFMRHGSIPNVQKTCSNLLKADYLIYLSPMKTTCAIKLRLKPKRGIFKKLGCSHEAQTHARLLKLRVGKVR
jgi:hypothetical protein